MDLKSELEREMFVLDSLEADFSTETWTFKATGVRVSGGSYLVISLREWQQFWERRQDSATPEQP
jgi:hypothetical protein